MMPQSQSADYNSTLNNAGGLIQPVPYSVANNHISTGHIPVLTSSMPNHNYMAAAIHLNQNSPGYVGPPIPGMYIYPGNAYLQTPNLMLSSNPGLLQGTIDVANVTSNVGGHIGSHHSNQKLNSYESSHFGSLPNTQTRKAKNSIMSKTNLYINGLADDDTDETVRQLVEGIIEPKSCKAMMSNGKCRGSGFIDCATEKDAETVIQSLRNKIMPDGTRLAVKFAYENEKDDLNVYVRNLPRNNSFTNNNLEDLFREFGQVVSVKLLQSDNQYTGTGFVRFSNAEEAQKAVETMNSRKKVIGEDDKPIICKLADKGGRRSTQMMPGDNNMSSHNNHNSNNNSSSINHNHNSNNNNSNMGGQHQHHHHQHHHHSNNSSNNSNSGHMNNHGHHSQQQHQQHHQQHLQHNYHQNGGNLLSSDLAELHTKNFTALGYPPHPISSQASAQHSNYTPNGTTPSNTAWLPQQAAPPPPQHPHPHQHHHHHNDPSVVQQLAVAHEFQSLNLAGAPGPTTPGPASNSNYPPQSQSHEHQPPPPQFIATPQQLAAAAPPGSVIWQNPHAAAAAAAQNNNFVRMMASLVAASNVSQAGANQQSTASTANYAQAPLAQQQLIHWGPPVSSNGTNPHHTPLYYPGNPVSDVSSGYHPQHHPQPQQHPVIYSLTPQPPHHNVAPTNYPSNSRSNPTPRNINHSTGRSTYQDSSINGNIATPSSTPTPTASTNATTTSNTTVSTASVTTTLNPSSVNNETISTASTANA